MQIKSLSMPSKYIKFQGNIVKNINGRVFLLNGFEWGMFYLE
jgi:hypothetical protein